MGVLVCWLRVSVVGWLVGWLVVSFVVCLSWLLIGLLVCWRVALVVD